MRYDAPSSNCSFARLGKLRPWDLNRIQCTGFLVVRNSLAREVIVRRAGSSHPEECEKPNDLPFLRYESAFRNPWAVNPWAVSPSPPRVLRFSSQSFHVTRP